MAVVVIAAAAAVAARTRPPKPGGIGQIRALPSLPSTGGDGSARHRPSQPRLAAPEDRGHRIRAPPSLPRTGGGGSVTMILHEVIRLYPSGIFLQRTTRKEIELGGIKYPEGANFTLPVPSIHHDPSIWGDASEFNLERFANGVSKATKFKTAFFMFGWGFLDLPWTELCNAGSQDGARHHAPELLL
uniref:Uncharacterized protein n=1 Tax=Oryza nivara TaxID=4536 RepID=A0A0E0FSM5_ORYNI